MLGILPNGTVWLETAQGKMSGRSTQMLRLFIAEEQGLLRNVYESYFSADPDIDLAGVAPEVSADGITRAAKAFRPHVILVGTKTLRGEVVDAVRRLGDAMPQVTPVLLSSSYDLRAAQGLLDHLQHLSTGFAFVLKDAVDSAEDLARLVRVAAAGHVVVAPGLMQDLIGVLQGYSGFFRDLSSRDIEVLELMARGESDDAIAQELGLPLGAVQEHVKGIYLKTGASMLSTHDPRVYTITTYLKAAGVLPVRDFRIRGEDTRSQANAVPENGALPWDPPVEDPMQELEGYGKGGNHNGSGQDRPISRARNGSQPGPLEALDLEDALKGVVRRYGEDARQEFARFAALAEQRDAHIAAKLLEWAARNNLKVRWGRGRAEGSASISLDVAGISFWFMTIWATGDIEVQFMMLAAQKPFADEGKRQELAERLENLVGTRVAEDDTFARPRVSLSALDSPDDLAQFLGTFDWVVRTIKRSWAARA